MSDADDSGFDKEAERERLREKYESEKEDRAAAEQMSDLLLKGATMTNAHCGECGSPIFRVDGQEFCPNCNVETEESAATDEPAAVDASAEAADSADDATPEPSPDEQLADVISGGADADTAEPEPTGGTSIAERAAASVQSGQDDSPSSTATAEPAGPNEPPAQPTQPASQPTPQPAGDASLADAQQSLLNAITHHARAATEADPRAAKDHLEAASEAAEALAEISPEN